MRRAIQVAAIVALAWPGAARAASEGGYSTVRNLGHGGAFTDHGIVQADPRIVLVFWGPSFRTVAFERRVVGAEKAMFRALAGSPYAAILHQYGVTGETRLEATFIDPRPPPGRALTLADARAEVRRASRLAGVANTFDTQWELFPSDSADISRFGGCGENGGFWSGRAHWGFTITLPFDQPSLSGGCIQADGGGQSLVGASTSATSHEWAELATDPLRDSNDGWWIKVGTNGLEQIADPCETQGTVPWGASGPVVQALWSNAAEGPGKRRGCVQSVWGGVPRCVGGDRPGDGCSRDQGLVAARRRS